MRSSSPAGTWPVAEGVLTSSQEVGAAIGLAMLTGVAAAADGGVRGDAMGGYDVALLAGAGLAIFGALLAVALFPSARRSR